MSMDLVIDLSGLQGRAAQAEQVFVRTLDRFVGRAAGEFAREEKMQAPKAFSTLVASIQSQKNAEADYTVLAGIRYARWVNDGTAPHTPPIKPLMEWLRLTKRVTDPRALFIRARGLQRFIAAHGTRANPFVARTRAKMDDRVIALLRDGAHQAAREAFQA